MPLMWFNCYDSKCMLSENQHFERKFVKMNNQFNYDDDGFVLVYIDGACFHNGKPNATAGLGVWFNHNHRM